MRTDIRTVDKVTLREMILGVFAENPDVGFRPCEISELMGYAHQGEIAWKLIGSQCGVLRRQDRLNRERDRNGRKDYLQGSRNA
jgi:hypothetical protein